MTLFLPIISGVKFLSQIVGSNSVHRKRFTVFNPPYPIKTAYQCQTTSKTIIYIGKNTC